MLNTRRFSPLIVLGSAALLLAGCGGDTTPDAAQTSLEVATGAAPEESALQGELTIFAAASLKASFDELAEKFMGANPEVIVLPISYDGLRRWMFLRPQTKQIWKRLPLPG